MKRNLILSITLLVAVTFMSAQTEIKLYPTGAAESNGIQVAESDNGQEFLLDISEARMYYYPATNNPAGTAVVICPGGGYRGVSYKKEGSEIAQWFNSKGVTAFVLHYRMPNTHFEIPLKDAQRAIELVRSNAKKYNVDKKKIGIMGFSAGGHLASTAGTQYTSAKNRPDFMILAYPVISMKKGLAHMGSRNLLMGSKPDTTLIQRFSGEDRVTPKTPPAFLFHAKDDKVVLVENSVAMHEALKKNNVPAELHVFAKGGHGFGMRPTNPETDTWPQLLEQWMLKMNFMSKVK